MTLVGLEVLSVGVLEVGARTGSLEIAPEVEFHETFGNIGTPAFREVVPGCKDLPLTNIFPGMRKAEK